MIDCVCHGGSKCIVGKKCMKVSGDSDGRLTNNQPSRMGVTAATNSHVSPCLTCPLVKHASIAFFLPK